MASALAPTPTPAPTTCPGLENVLSIYTYDFYNDTDHRQFVIDNFEADTATLVALALQNNRPCADADTVRILKHMAYRVPVYFGHTVHSCFDNQRLQEVLGYNASEAADHWTEDEPQYAIVGPVEMMNHRNNVAVVHTWGVNLESPHTEDYKKYVLKGWKLKREEYTQRYFNMFRLIVKAAQQVCVSPTGAKCKRARVRCPLIGMGAFLGAVGDPSEAHDCFVDAAKVVFEEETVDIDFTFCVLDQHHPLASKLDTVPNVSLGIGSTHGNLMRLPKSEAGIMDVVVNAWDNRSFVGNGGSRDPTIDGFVVANAGGYNTDFRNTSYLHNCFFNPSMRDPSNWVSV